MNSDLKINLITAQRILELSETRDKFSWIRTKSKDWVFWVKAGLLFITSKVALEQLIMLVRHA